jgi:methyltransferase (TIGR00027 family)
VILLWKNKTKRIESKISRTAEMTCLSRATSFYEKKPQYRNNDFIAPKLVPGIILPFLKLEIFRKIYKSKLSPNGMYEYVIARTKYIDSIFEKAILKEFDQILVFGAGFDSRGIRFLNKNSKTNVFELDVPITQNAKMNQLKKRGVELNPHIIFISIDFNKESLENKLDESGFRKNRKSLFVLEGLTMYLSAESVDSTFRAIEKISGINSEIVFDYVYLSVLRRENIYYGEKDVFNTVNKTGENWTFGIEKGEIETFLKDHNLRLIEHNNSEELENKYFKDEYGNIIGKINGTHCITYAKK